MGEDDSFKFKEKIKKYNFSTFWFLNNIEIFNYFLPINSKKSFNYLEIGSYEGMSLLYVLEKYNKAKVSCVDLWNNLNIEKNFKKNINKYLNVKKIKSDSIIALRKLNQENKKFDYIYVDGLHEGSHLIVDAIESFKILKKNGIMIIDDFIQDEQSLLYQSYQGIFYFLELFKKEIEILYFQNILVLKKNRRDGRVVEGARLESVYTVKGIKGSNPFLSAS